jgi:Ca-activated chloride channel family protein
VRIEEMLNYFDYDFIKPQKGEPFALNAQISDCPWNPDSRLMVLGIQAQELTEQEYLGSNLVFLIDVSGSMEDANKLPLLKESFMYLTQRLSNKDRVSIVTYATGVETVLEGAKGNNKVSIEYAIDNLRSGGATSGSDGLKRAYALAEENFIEGGNNRIIMASDGDLNVGITSKEELHDFISEKRSTGVYLSVLGFGTGNYKDDRMETLADKGNGNYHYIDTIDEAKKVFGEDLLANLVSVADDVKLQLSFNPEIIKGYRQIGYENRALNDEDFLDDTKDATEMGAGHQAIVVYEIVMTEPTAGAIDYGSAYEEDLAKTTTDELIEEWCSVSLRYKQPGGNVSKGIRYSLNDRAYTNEPDKDWTFVTGVVELGLVLSHSSYAGTSSLNEALQRVRVAEKASSEKDERRQELIELITSLSK